MNNKFTKPYVLSPEAQKQIEDAIKIIQMILLMDIDESMKKKIIDTMLWNITGANGKTNTKYRSKKVIDNDNVKVNHEHVYTKKSLIKKILFNPNDLVKILKDAVACVVTEEEHKILTINDKKYPGIEGWERYKKANIKVWDMEIDNEFKIM